MHDSTELSGEEGRRCAAVSKCSLGVAITTPRTIVIADFDVFAPLSGIACSWLDIV